MSLVGVCTNARFYFYKMTKTCMFLIKKIIYESAVNCFGVYLIKQSFFLRFNLVLL